MDESLRFSARMGIPDDVVTGIRRSTSVIVMADDEIAGTTEGQVMLEVAVNLLSRIFPRVQVDVANLPAPFLKVDNLLKDHLTAVAADGYRWDSSLTDGPLNSSVYVVVGNRQAEGPAIYIDADGWISYAGTVPSGLSERSSAVPIGAVVSACIGVAEVFKKLFGPHIAGRVVPIDGQFWFNALTYRDDRTNISIGGLNVDGAVLFGCGSVGSSLLYTLGFLSDAGGKIDLVDRDPKVDFKNLQRYSLLTVSDLQTYQGASKAKWAAAKIGVKLPGVQSLPWDGDKGTVIGYLDSIPSTPGIRLAISAVDNVESRIQIADCLARRSINAGTGDTTLTVTRHGFADGHACLACANVSQAPDVPWYQQISEKTGVSVDRTAFLMQGKALLDRNDLNKMISKGFIAEIQLDDLLGTDFASLVNRHLYSAVNIQNKGGDRPVTAPFVSLMAGAILAGELIKETAGIAHLWHGNKYQTDMMSLPEIYTNSVAIAGRSCLCANAFRRAKYKALWG